MKKNILKALAIGMCAGAIDILPMLIGGLSWQENLSAFIHWMVLGLIIPFVNWPLIPCAKGVVIALSSAVPIILVVKDTSAVFPILVSSVILGALTGLAGDKFITKSQTRCDV